MRVRQGSARTLRWFLVSALVAVLLTQAAPPTRADDSLSDLNKQLQEIQRQKQNADNELARVNVEATEATKQLELVIQEYTVANGQLQVLKAQKAVAEQDLKKTDAELKEAEVKYAIRKQTMASRIRSINEEGRVNYLAVLFGATSFGDFIARFDMLKMVVKRDGELFAVIRTEKKGLEDKKAAAVEKKMRLETLVAQETERADQVAAKKAEQETVSRTLDRRKSSLIDQLDDYDRVTQEINQKIWEIQQREKRKGGKFAPLWPVKNSSITDVFGPRLHPILGVWRQHNGTDFAVRHGTPVYAIEDGVVIVAGWNDAYGNLVVIDHGDGVASWYGHSSRLLVKQGQAVTQGQQISEAGSTGWSTGPHLHLEIHANGKPQDPMGYLD